MYSLFACRILRALRLSTEIPVSSEYVNNWPITDTALSDASTNLCSKFAAVNPGLTVIVFADTATIGRAAK